MAAVLLIYTIVMGFLGDVPRQPILNETIRNLYFHVTMWFAMFIITLVSLIYSIKYLNSEKLQSDYKAEAFASVGLLLGILGLLTGMVWVNYTWNANPNKILLWVKEDVKLNAAAMGTLMYVVYFILRSSVEDPHKKARFAAVFNIFAFVMLILFTTVIPRLSDSSLHPGNAGNPGFNMYDVSSEMRMVFYPAVIGWTLLATWIANLRVRLTLLKNS